MAEPFADLLLEQTLGSATAAMAGVLTQGDPAARWFGAAIDSRKVQPRQLFFALPGEKTDGHAFVASALARGAAAAIVERDLAAPIDGAVIRVADSLAALHALTRAVRRQRPQHLVGITGSAGKTTTKELIAAFLARRYRVAKSPGNFNNLLGFPLGLLEIPEDCEWMVAEMGMSTPGELGRVSRLGRPEVAVYTNVRPVHLENFASLEAIAEAKAELLHGVPDGGLMIANASDPRVMRIAEIFASQRNGRVVTFGAPGADVTATDLRPLADEDTLTGTRFALQSRLGVGTLELPLHGAYNVENCQAAAACAIELGVGLDDLAAALLAMRPAPHRGEVVRLASGALLVDDCYNSNPDAAIKALESARQLQGERFVAVLGDMLELGPQEDALHAEVGAAAARLGFDRVVAVGRRSRHLADAYTRGGGAQVEWLENAAAAADWARASGLATGDVVLVKASRGTALEAVVDAFQGAAG
jgi:UDP-N-acetylmuramoyl-tripeptide--D-alanyl-D-alanine ligase